MRQAPQREMSKCIPCLSGDEAQSLCNSNATACAQRFITQYPSAFLINQEMRFMFCVFLMKLHALSLLSHNVPFIVIESQFLCIYAVSVLSQDFPMNS